MNDARRVRVFVTRPAAQGAIWVARLRERGIDAEPLPLIDIVPLADQSSLQDAWRALGTRRLAVFVSANAVEQFFAASARPSTWPQGVAAGAPGPGTAGALRTAGVPEDAIVSPPDDADHFDSEALWARLVTQDWRGTSVLIVRGDGGRDWLGDRLREAGAEVETLSAYHRAAPAFADGSRDLLEAAAASERTLWLFSSSEAIANLADAAGGARWHGARAIATHPRIAARARSLGFGTVVEAAPSLDAVVACIQSFGP